MSSKIIGKTINIVCEYCGKNATVQAYYKYTPKFCSASCSGKAHNPLKYDKCTISGCTKQNHIGGLCQMHHWRLKYHGDPNYVPHKKRTCSIDGCNRPHKAYGLCALHYNRKKSGLPMNFTLPVLDKKRYRLLYRPNHPMAIKNGRVLEHRMILFDFIGYDRVPCFWCGTGLVFGKNLHVDHLNHNRQDNRIENLVPSCNKCNAGRTIKSPMIRNSMYT